MEIKRKRRGTANGRAPRVTIRDVAAAAGVSMMTVSNVLHNRPNVGAKSRERVLAQIKRLGFVPNRAAQELAGVAPTRFGLLYSGRRNTFIAAVVVGAITAAARFNAEISIQLADLGDPETLRKTIRRMEDAGIEGFLLPSPVAERIAAAPSAFDLQVPAVAIAPGPRLAGLSSVRCDERQAAHDLVTRLLALGHTRIGHIHGPEIQSGSVARHAGYCAALAEHGIAVNPDHVVHSAFNFTEGLKAAETLLSRRPRVTAIFAGNDTLAACVLAAAHRMGVAVPENLSVVGYDNAPVAELLWPQLTTVHQDATQMTERAVELLHQQVQQWRITHEPQSPQDLVLPYEIIERQSTAPARGPWGQAT